MIKYTLRCAKDHRFDSWFRDSATYEKQEKRRLLECPVCGDSKVERALVAPNVAAKGNRKAAEPSRSRRPSEEPTTPAEAPAQPVATVPPNMPPELRKVLLELRGQVEKNCDYVGDKFADEARKIHYGETDKRGIYGETSDDEAAALADEGIEFGRLPWVPKGN
ncbi:MAG: DUF1178 family protein [Alphaproteobacteria bacterium]|nr:DUF1178 family protein [Alphaproteobacteria bacterium]